jgi:hypothetical protein
MGWSTHQIHTCLKASWSIGAHRFLSEFGFSLTEIMAAVVVFSCGLIGLGSMQITAIKLNAEAHITTQIAALGQEQMEELLALPFTDPVLQDNAVAVGQGTTYCVLYPPEGIRPCREKFTSSYPPPAGFTYCAVITQPSGELNCSDISFPPPTGGYKVQWTVDVDNFGNSDPTAVKLLYIDITASQKTSSKSQTKQTKTYKLSFAKSSR